MAPRRGWMKRDGKRKKGGGEISISARTLASFARRVLPPSFLPSSSPLSLLAHQKDGWRTEDTPDLKGRGRRTRRQLYDSFISGAKNVGEKGAAATPAKKRRDERAHYARAVRTFFTHALLFPRLPPISQRFPWRRRRPLEGRGFPRRAPFVNWTRNQSRRRTCDPPLPPQEK